MDDIKKALIYLEALKKQKQLKSLELLIKSDDYSLVNNVIADVDLLEIIIHMMKSLVNNEQHFLNVTGQLKYEMDDLMKECFLNGRDYKKAYGNHSNIQYLSCSRCECETPHKLWTGFKSPVCMICKHMNALDISNGVSK